MNQLTHAYAISHKSAKLGLLKAISKLNSADLRKRDSKLKMPYYNGGFKTLEELEEDYNNNAAPEVFSFAGVLHRWCEPHEIYPTLNVSNVKIVQTVGEQKI